MRQHLNPPGTAPMGAYSQGISVPIGDAALVLTAGQIAADEAGEPLAPGDVAEQARIVFDRVRGVLEAAGGSLQDVVKVQIFLTDMAEFGSVAEVRNNVLAGIDPVSTVVEISKTVIDGCNIEVEAMAIVSKQESGTS